VASGQFPDSQLSVHTGHTFLEPEIFGIPRWAHPDPSPSAVPELTGSEPSSPPPWENRRVSPSLDTLRRPRTRVHLRPLRAVLADGPIPPQYLQLLRSAPAGARRCTWAAHLVPNIWTYRSLEMALETS
jgi:hypothetical protein